MLLCGKFIGPHLFEGVNSHEERAAKAKEIYRVL